MAQLIPIEWFCIKISLSDNILELRSNYKLFSWEVYINPALVKYM